MRTPFGLRCPILPLMMAAYTQTAKQALPTLLPAISRAVLLALLAFTAAACSSSPATCVPGSSVLCACPSGSSGAQTCGQDGKFGPCVCAPSSSPFAGAPNAQEPAAQVTATSEPPAAATSTPTPARSRAVRSGSAAQYDTVEAQPAPRNEPAVHTEAARLLEGALAAGGGSTLADVLRAQAQNAEPQGGANSASQPSVVGNSGGVGNLGALATGARDTNSTATAPSSDPTSPAPEAPSVRGNIGFGGGDVIGGSGDFDSKLVTAEVRKRLAAIKACYEQQLRRNPALQGKITMEFTIEQSGIVSKATATSNTTNDPAVAACVSETVKRFQFSPGPQGGSVTYSSTFTFASQ